MPAARDRGSRPGVIGRNLWRRMGLGPFRKREGGTLIRFRKRTAARDSGSVCPEERQRSRAASLHQSPPARVGQGQTQTRACQIRSWWRDRLRFERQFMHRPLMMRRWPWARNWWRAATASRICPRSALENSISVWHPVQWR